MKKLATMQDVAREAGVSRQLVSLVIRDTGYVAPEKRRAVLEVAERLGYRRNNLAASLAGKRTQTIGLVVLDIHNQVYADFADGVRKIIEPAGYRLLLAFGSENKTGATKGLETLLGLRVDGVLIASHTAVTHQVASLLGGVPAVVMGEKPKSSKLDSVRGNDRRGMYSATQHLILQGNTSIAYISGPQNTQNEQRHLGYVEAIEAAGLTAQIVTGDATEAGGSLAFMSMAQGKPVPQAIVCYNDSTALGVLAAARSQGFKIPENISIVGYDNTRVSGYPGIELSTIDSQATKIGEVAAGMLMNKIQNPDREAILEILEPQLIVRDSSSFSR